MSLATFWHVPCAFAHVLHVPHELDEQQVLSTQLPDSQSAPMAQLDPGGFLPQLMLAHMNPVAQSSPDAHEVLHMLVAGSHLYDPQLCVSEVGQLPLPSQLAAFVSVEDPVGQEAARHAVLVPHLRQAPWPLQKPSLPQVASAAGGQPLFGSLPPSGMLVQTPSDPVSEQLRQTPVQSLSQQTPSMQLFDWHSPRSVHEAPLFFRPHIPMAQGRPLAHWAASVHEL